MKIRSLASGSAGNALIVKAEDGRGNVWHVMFDCGFSSRQMDRRLREAGVNPADIDALFITHEHVDHAAGVPLFPKRHGIPVWMSEGTFQAIKGDFSDADVSFFRDGDTVTVGPLEIRAFTVSHDAREPLQYVVTKDSVKFGMLTDTGRVTDHIAGMLSGCTALMLECNYDPELIDLSSYPFSVKERIKGPFGHLSNDDAIAFMNSQACASVTRMIVAHVSLNSNVPDNAYRYVSRGIRRGGVEVTLASREEGFDWIDLSDG